MWLILGQSGGRPGCRDDRADLQECGINYTKLIKIDKFVAAPGVGASGCPTFKYVFSGSRSLSSGAGFDLPIEIERGHDCFAESRP
jgi:hypothetical protein